MQNLHIITGIQNLFYQKVILMIMKNLNVNITLPKRSTIIYNSTLTGCLFGQDFILLISGHTTWQHTFAREVKWILPNKSQHFRFFVRVVCLWYSSLKAIFFEYN